MACNFEYWLGMTIIEVNSHQYPTQIMINTYTYIPSIRDGHLAVQSRFNKDEFYGGLNDIDQYNKH